MRMKMLAAAFGILLSGGALAAGCPAPETFAVHGVHLGATVAEVQKTLPDAKLDKNDYGGNIDVPHDKLPPDIGGFSHISVNKEGKIQSFAVRFSGGNLGVDEAPVEEVLARLTKAYGFPGEGWQKQALMSEGEMKELGYDARAAKMVLPCGAYTVEVSQDFAVGRQSSGAVLLVSDAAGAAQ